MVVKVTVPDDLYAAAVSLADKRGLATDGNGLGVPAVIRMALKAYISKYSKRGIQNDDYTNFRTKEGGE